MSSPRAPLAHAARENGEAFVLAHTILSHAPLVPEIALHLATEITPIWQATEDWLAERNVDPPFWAFAWPGGQALARHVLDHPETVAGRRVLDFAAGGGIAAIACARAGAIGGGLRDPKQYPVLSIACASTHDLPTLVGGRRGADIGERLSLGFISLANAERAIADRKAEKREMLAALRRVGALGPDPIELEDEMTVALAAAIHYFLANSGSALASAQFDDLAGEAIATNLPGTDRERPNWRRRHPVDVETLLTRPRAAEILAAMAKGRT